MCECGWKFSISLSIVSARVFRFRAIKSKSTIAKHFSRNTPRTKKHHRSKRLLHALKKFFCSSKSMSSSVHGSAICGSRVTWRFLILHLSPQPQAPREIPNDRSDSSLCAKSVSSSEAQVAQTTPCSLDSLHTCPISLRVRNRALLVDEFQPIRTDGPATHRNNTGQCHWRSRRDWRIPL